MAPAHSGSIRRVLIVAYYFPPMGLSGVQRVAKFAKYLPQHGWEPTILTVKPGGYYAFDDSLSEEIEQAGIQVVRTSSLDPTRLFGRGQSVEMPGAARRKWWRRFTQFLFIPDNKIGWFPMAFRQGNRILRDQDFDAIFSSAPPYTTHLIASALSRHTGTPLVIDYRDDWIGSTHHGYPTALHRRLHERLENRVIRQTKRVVTINSYIQQALVRRHPKKENAIHVIPHGFDPQDFANDAVDLRGESPGPANDREPNDRKASRRMIFLYSGVFYDAQQPDPFLRALARLFDRHPEARTSITAEFVGHFPRSGRALVRQLGIDDNVRLYGYLPHAQVVRLLKDADLLWMVVGRQEGERQVSTSKLFEYFGARKPVFGLVPPGAAHDAIADYGAGSCAPPDDIDAVTDALDELYHQWKEGTLPIPDDENVRPFDRQNLAAQLADILQESMRVWR